MEANIRDIELWSAFKKGNRDAFAVLFKRHYSTLFQYGTKVYMDSVVVEDCIQELFIELWKNNSAPEIQSVRAYLLTALKYKLFRIYRSKTSARSIEETQGNTVFEISHENFMITHEEDLQKTEHIIAALKQLSARQNEIIYLKIYQNLSYEEITEVMDINYQAARNLFSQSIKSLRKILVSPQT